MTGWVDFKTLRRSLDFAAVLAHYGVELKVKGDQHQGFCPLPTHPTHAGKRRSPSFSANLVKGIWRCFGCGSKGNILDFAVLMEGGNPTNSDDLRKTALGLQERFGDSSTTLDDTQNGRVKAPKRVRDGIEETTAGEVIINAPLDFELKSLDPTHPYLRERGFSEETIAHFGLGYCSRGLMKGRIAIPLHDNAGVLIGYAGRLTDETAIDDKHPKYLFPAPRERDGKRCEFHKSLFVYNGHRVERPVSDLIVVEGFPGVWWLWQAGFKDVVGLMGSDCSPEQARIIVESTTSDGRVWIMPDGDEAGERCAASVLKQVSPRRFIRWVRLENGRQPTDCTPDDLAALLWPEGILCSRCGSPASGSVEHAGEREFLCGDCLEAAREGTLHEVQGK